MLPQVSDIRTQVAILLALLGLPDVRRGCRWYSGALSCSEISNACEYLSLDSSVGDKSSSGHTQPLRCHMANLNLQITCSGRRLLDSLAANTCTTFLLAMTSRTYVCLSQQSQVGLTAHRSEPFCIPESINNSLQFLPGRRAGGREDPVDPCRSNRALCRRSSCDWGNCDSECTSLSEPTAWWS